MERQAKLGAAIKKAGLAGLALNPGPSLRYITGLEFHLSERPVIGIFTPSSLMTLILPELEAMKTEGVGYKIETISYPEDPTMWPKAIEKGVKAARLDGDTIGVEALSFRVLELRFLEAAMPNANIVTAQEIVASLRMRKDADELACMRATADIAQKALQEALPKIKIGMTEQEAATEISTQLFRHGSGSTLPFPPIMSSGPNSANPHAFPSERTLADGDLLVIDWGASVEGYFSDITRTFAVGEVEEEYAKIHQIVQDANAAARAVVKPGVTCAAVDKAARGVIEKAGYGDYFIHRTGHGLGMEGHEEPYMRAGNQMKLEPGMTFTIEPGIYLPGRGGVRIEDDVVVTEDGMASFTDMPREMRFVG
jgi:Xaa-Pro dipeptidase